ncbi:G-type lectin S-receptor-like serine/threonine-protein kinase At1g67520 [Ipomoea triloba]|uniref:G-type lectin S-receptor-like serine/threonine-protein kinase At1g67520 n=1 Tax=Ipomoea triloba TaxID=35885 RepID=UPI00125E21EF|nr:G-type lectin S-receptor-like serine/threonine-protein kinase At1g67520 [Ipomoea triloba]
MSRIIFYDSLVVGIVGFFICHALLLSYVSAKDRLSPGEYILPTDEVYLRSSYKIFELKLIRGPTGTSSTTSCYLCIQFTEYPILASSQQMIVWVAWLGQAQISLVPGPELKMERDGRLAVSADHHEFPVNDDQQYPYVMNTTATLLDTGNLVLRTVEGHTRTSWQSFDHPTANTWLPGMILGRFGVKTRGVQQRCLTSWTSEGNPSPGDFSLCVDPNNPKQLVATRKGIVYWHSGVWSGRNNNFPFLPVLSHHLRYFSNDNESYFAWDGNVDPHSTFIRTFATGEISVAVKHDRNLTRASINCDHNGTYYSNVGCVRSSNCSAGDRFRSTTGFIGWELQLHDIMLGDCNEMCVNNCSCNAYATLESDGTGCKFSTSTAYRYVSNGGETFYIRDAKTAKQSHRPPPRYPALALTRRMSHHRRTTIVVALTVTLLVTLSVVFLVWYMNRRKCCSCFQAPIVPSTQQLASKDDDLPFFNFKSIEIATNYFSDENKLGQ